MRGVGVQAQNVSEQHGGGPPNRRGVEDGREYEYENEYEYEWEWEWSASTGNVP